MSELAAAFIEAQSEFPRIVKATPGQQGNRTYLYADLPSIIDAVYPVLHKHGLGVRQVFDGDIIKTQLIHKSGSCVDSVLPCSQDGLNPQDFGKKITYYRRYALVAMLGLSPDDDNDASGVPAAAGTPVPQKAPPRSRDPLPLERLLTEDKDLVKAWSPSIKTQADAERVVADLLDVLRGELDAGADLYTAARRHMSSELDKRAAG